MSLLYKKTLNADECVYMKLEISAAFTLTGFDSDPEEITKILGILPTETCRVGDLIGRSILRRKENAWVLKSQLEKTANLESHIKDVLTRLQPNWQKLVEICPQYYTEISCVIYSVEAKGSPIHFDKQIIKSAFELNVEIDVDYFCFHKSKSLNSEEYIDIESKISAAFTLSGFNSDPKEITSLLGILPTETFRVGDLIEKSILHRQVNAWVLKSQLEKTADLESHIKDVLARLQPSWEKLVEICSKYDSEISCVIYSVEAQGEVISFDKEIIKSAAELRAEIDVDYYCLHKSE